MGDISVIPLVDEGLGNCGYLLDLDDGRALAVDASRDLRALRLASARRGLRVAYAADTHLHADFLTGAVQLARTDGAQVLASAAGNREYPHAALADDDEVDLGGLRLRALATPGHTHEHIAYAAGHVPGADHIELGALATRAETLPDEPLVVMCGHGERAMGAASLLARAGHHDVTVLDGGPQDWADQSGDALEVGP